MNSKRHVQTRWCAWAAAVVLLAPNCFGGGEIQKDATNKKPAEAVATAQSGPSKAQPAAQTTEMVGMSGQRVHIDPKTRKIKDPEPEETKALEEEIQKTMRPAPVLQVERMPDGTLKVDLQEQFMESTIIRMGPEGRLSMECVTGNAKDAEEALKKPKPQTTTKEKLDEK